MIRRTVSQKYEAIFLSLFPKTFNMGRMKSKIKNYKKLRSIYNKKKLIKQIKIMAKMYAQSMKNLIKMSQKAKSPKFLLKFVKGSVSRIMRTWPAKAHRTNLGQVGN